MAKNKFGKNAIIHWQDRKRWCGLPLTFTKYYIVESPGRWIKLFWETGFLHTAIEEVQLYRIDDFSVYESLINKMFGVGNLDVYFNDASHNKLRITRVKNTYKVYSLLSELIEQDRGRRKVSHAEMQR